MITILTSACELRYTGIHCVIVHKYLSVVRQPSMELLKCILLSSNSIWTLPLFSMTIIRIIIRPNNKEIMSFLFCYDRIQQDMHKLQQKANRIGFHLMFHGLCITAAWSSLIIIRWNRRNIWMGYSRQNLQLLKTMFDTLHGHCLC